MFWIVTAVGLANCIVTLTQTRGIEWRDASKPRFDGVGALIYAIALPAVLVGLSLLPGTRGISFLVAGVAGLVVFVLWETRVRNPIFRVDLMRHNRVFAFSNLSSLINYSATFAMTFLISLYLVYIRGLNTQTAGFVLVAGLFFQAVSSAVAGRLVDRMPPKLVASGGMALCVLGLLGLSFLGKATPYWHLIALLCVLGVGFGFFAPAITHAVMGSVSKRDVSIASATLATMRMAGQNLSLALATLVLALLVGEHEIRPADYPHVLTSVQITFAIFTALCAVGLVASLVGPKRRTQGV